MQRHGWSYFVITALMAVAIAGCEGPEGPAGPAGPAGSAGAAGQMGPTGPAGDDINENCTQCHVNDMTLYAKQQQFALADHGPGQYYRGTGVCANCHSHQGFLARQADGLWDEDRDITDAAPMNCRTCHQIHTTYTDSDFAFTASDPVAFRVAGVSVDLGDAGNLCASCHQSRPRDDMPVIDGDDVIVDSSHWGPHGSPQGDMFAGVGFYDFEGGNGGMFAHASDDRGRGCPTCHMAATTSNSTGGHTFQPSTVGCDTCHSGETEDFDKFGQQTATQALIHELGELLETAGIAHFDEEDGAYHPIEGTYPANVAAAFWNLAGAQNDGSLGVHNPPYIKALLEGAIDELGAAAAIVADNEGG